MNKKIMFTTVIAIFAILSSAIVLGSASDEEVDANAFNHTFELKVGEPVDILIYRMSGSRNVVSDIPYLTNINTPFELRRYSTPPGTTASEYSENNFDYYKLIGTPTSPGSYNWWISTHDHTFSITFSVSVGTFDVTYNAGIGKVNGQTAWTEQIVSGTHASLPTATYTTGAYIFKGWSLTSGGTTTVSTPYTVTSNVTLYAVWEQASVTISSYSATVTQGQPFSHTFTTNPTTATIAISNYGGLSSSQISVSGKTVSGTPTASPGTYNVTLTASASGYKTTTTTLKITIPITITQPIEYTQAIGTLFSYEPATDPQNATITITGVKLGSANYTGHGFTVSNNRVINGIPTDLGTVAITFSASATGYVTVSKTVMISVYEPPATGQSASIDSIIAVQRADTPRVFDLTAIGVANAVSITWKDPENNAFSSSSVTSVFTCPSSGAFSLTCTVVGADGVPATATVTVVCTDSYHREMAWVGVEYSYLEKYVSAYMMYAPYLTYERIEVNGVRYATLKGTPTSEYLGMTYKSMGAHADFDITVYAKEDVAPVSSFDVSVDDMIISVTFTGSHASVVYFDFGEGWTSDTSYEAVPGYYNVRCMAINNIGERIVTEYVEIEAEGVPVGLSLDALTDYIGIAGEPIIIDILGMIEGDVLTISGTASAFLTVDGNRISGSTNEVGTYSLTITVTHADDTTDTGSIFVYIKAKNGGGGNGNDDDDDGDDEYSLLDKLLFVAFVVIILLIIAYLVGRRKK